MTILLSDKEDIIKDVDPKIYDFDTVDQAHDLIIYWLENKNFNGSVFFMFDIKIIDGVADIRESHNFLISNDVKIVMDRITQSVRENNVFAMLEASDYNQAFDMGLDISPYW